MEIKKDEIIEENNFKEIQSEFVEKRQFVISLAEVARLKYKCLISVVGLLECNDCKSDFIMRIMRIIPVSLLA